MVGEEGPALANADQKKYIEELQTSKKWLEEQYSSLNAELKNCRNTNDELKKYIEELQNGKSWLEQHSEEQEKYIKSLLKNK